MVRSAFTMAAMSRTHPLRRFFDIAAVMAMLVVGTLAADKATAHAAMAMVAATQPPCHRMQHADGLAQARTDPCDTVCAGSAPESSYDALPARIEPPVAVVTALLPVSPPALAAAVTLAAHYGHGPPPPPPYLRDRRLLI